MTILFGWQNYWIYFTTKDVSKLTPSNNLSYLNISWSLVENNHNLFQIVLREDEDRRRRENMMFEEERLKKEKDDLDYRYR